jgi:hypothetical protein
MRPGLPLSVRRPVGALALSVGLSLMAATEGLAQKCYGEPVEFPRSLAIEYGRASGNAHVLGADLVWRLSETFSVFGDGGVTAYRSPDPRRDRLGVGVTVTALSRGDTVLKRGSISFCPSLAIEGERITILTDVRVPVGVIVAWSRTSTDGRTRFGLSAEPFVVYTGKSVSEWTHTSGLISGRAGLFIGYRRLLGGIEYENAFDNDAKWNARLRLGFAF